MKLCHPYRVRTRRITIKDRVAPYPKLFHPFRVFIEFTLNNVSSTNCLDGKQQAVFN